MIKKMGETIVPLFIKIPKKILVVTGQTKVKKITFSMSFNVFGLLEWALHYRNIWNEMKFPRWEVPSCITFKIISALQSNWLRSNSLIASYFFWFMVNILRDLCVVIVAREKRRLVPINAIPKGRPKSIGMM